MYGKLKNFDINSINQVNMTIFLPALIFHVMSDKSFVLSQYNSLIIGGAFIVLGSGLLLLPIIYFFHINWKTFLPPMMFNNSGNLGIPIIVLAFGEKALPAAVALFFIQSMLQFTIGEFMLNTKAKLYNIFKMPFVIAATLGLIINFSKLSLPDSIVTSISMVADVAIPLILFSLGARMAHITLSDWKLGVLGGLLCPLSGIAAFMIILPFIDINESHKSMLLIFSILPPAVLSYIFAEKYQQEPQRVASIIVTSHIFSLIIIPISLWYTLKL